MTCKYKVKIKDIQYNYKVQMTDIQSKYKFKIFCTGYDDSEIKDKIDAMYQAFPKVSGEGETITLNDTANTTMAIELKGNTSQVVSGDNTINVMGKNMADVNDRSIGYFNANGSINTYYGNNSTHFNKYMFIDLSNYATLSFKAKKTLTIGRITTYLYDEEYNPIANGGAFRWGDLTINAGETKVISHTIVATPSITNAKYFRMAIYAVKDENNQAIAINTKFDEYIENFQVEMGDVASPIYTPYQGASYPINLGDIELENGDSIQKINNSWNIVRNNATIEPITDTTLIGQLEALKKAQSYSGQTNISQVNNDAPFTISATALIDLSNLGTSTTNTLSTTNINRLETTSIRSSISPDNLEVNNSEETPEEE